jgi:hypothetical protein
VSLHPPVSPHVHKPEDDFYFPHSGHHPILIIRTTAHTPMHPFFDRSRPRMTWPASVQFRSAFRSVIVVGFRTREVTEYVL